MRYFAVLVLTLVAAFSASAQCPASGETDVNKASAATLASMAGINPAAAGRMVADIRTHILEGYSDLAALAEKYRVSLPAQLVVCAPPAPLAQAESIDPEREDAINVNSASEEALRDLTTCGVTAAEIHRISVVNNSRTSFVNLAALQAFLAKHTPAKATVRFCNGLTFKLNSR